MASAAYMMKRTARFITLRSIPITHAAIAASAAGAAAVCAWFLIGGIGGSVFYARPVVLLEMIAGLPITFLVMFAGALLLFALPASIVFGTLAHAIAGCSKAVSTATCALVGLCVGMAIWLAVSNGQPIEWLAATTLVGGIAGATGGYAFAKAFNRFASRPGFALRAH